MFRKIQDRLTAALGTASTASNEEDAVQRLVALGCTADQAASALAASNGNVDRAAEVLLLSSTLRPEFASSGIASATSASSEGGTNQGQSVNDSADEAALQRVLQQSLEEEKERRRTPRTAAMSKAAAAAIQRAEGPAVGQVASQERHAGAQHRKGDVQQRQLATTHPAVRLLPKLQDKSLEEQVLRTADRMKSHVTAVDTLHKCLTMIQKFPDNQKYRQLDARSTSFSTHVAPAPGALDFLRAMHFLREENYNPSNPSLYWRLYGTIDPALLYLGISALEQTRLTPEYIQGKRTRAVERTVDQILTATVSPQEAAQRQALLRGVPNGNGGDASSTSSSSGTTLIQIQLTSTITVRRKFDADDTVQTVLDWLAGTYGTALVERLLWKPEDTNDSVDADYDSQVRWCLVDWNASPVMPLDLSPMALQRTLQYVGCWPSGRWCLQAASTTSAETTGAASNIVAVSRGLASGTSSDDE